MVEFRAIIGGMQSKERRLIEARRADENVNHDLTTALAFGAALGFLITAVATRNVRRANAESALATAALRQNQAQLHAMVQGVQDYGFVMWGPTGHVLSWNTGSERMTGFSSAEMVGQDVKRFFLADDIERGRPKEILEIAARKGLLEVQGVRLLEDHHPYSG